ncbi:MAG: hypothetical protein L3J74_13670 [Bacteroidales bacterium]|nr:hypothetical protein [Bacteroidales bacterium]
MNFPSIDFDKIRFELSQRHIKLTNFKLTADTVVYQQLLDKGIENTAVYDIKVHSIEFWGTSFYKLFFKKHLRVKEFFIDKPVIKLKKSPDDKQQKSQNRDFIHQDLYPLINKYVNILEVKYINVENGQFQLRLSKDSTSKTSHFGAISVKLYDFYLDKEVYELTKKLFYSNDIQISINNYRIRLSDGIHNFYAKNIYISTKESLLKAKSVQILPVSKHVKIDSEKISGYYYFRSPEIHFHNFNISNLYFNKNIEIQNIIIDAPKIKLLDIEKNKFDKNKNKTVSNQVQNTKGLDFYKLIKGSLNSISIKTLDLNHAELELIHQKNLNKPAYHIKDFNLSLLDFLLNERSGDEPDRILYSKNIRLNLNDFKANIIDNTHALKAKQINIHTDTKSIYIKNISIHPIQNTGRLKQIMNFKISDIKLSGTDFYRLIKRKELIIQKTVMGSSNINLQLFKKENKKTENLISKLAGAFLKRLSIHKIQLKNSDFKILTYQNDSILGSYSGKVNFDLRYLNFYSRQNSFNKMFSVYAYKILLNNYNQQITDRIHILNAQSIYVSNTDSLIQINDLEIHPRIRAYNELKKFGKANIIDLSIKKTIISGVDIQGLLLQKNLTIEQVKIGQPLFKILHFKDISEIKTDSLSRVSIETQSTRTGDSIILPKTFNALLSKYFNNLSIKNLNINKGIFLFSKSDSLNNEKINTRGRLSLKLDSLDYSYFADSVNYGKVTSSNLKIHITDFYRHLIQQPYLIKAKNIEFSQKDSLFSAKIVRWFPDKNAIDSLFGKNIITAYSPEISFSGIDLNQFSNTNILNLGLLRIKDPSISILKNKNYLKNKASSSLKQNSFTFEKVITDSIIISGGSFGILNNKNKIEEKLLNTDFNIYLSKIQIDTTFLKEPINQLKNVATIVHLKNFKYQNPDKKLNFDFNHFYLNSAKKLILLDNLLYYTDKTDSIENLFESVFIPAVQMKNFSYADLLLHQLVADSLQIIEPYFVIINKAKKKDINPFEINLYEKIKKTFKKIDLTNIDIENAALKIKNKGNINQPVTNYSNIYGSVSKLFIDSLHPNDKNKFFNTSDISFLIKNYSTTIDKGFYNVDIGEMGFSTGQQEMYAKRVVINPVLSRETLAKSAKTEIKLLYINAPEINIHRTDFKSFISDKKIIAQSIDFIDLKLHSFKNKHFPLDSSIKSALPFKDMIKMKTYIKIDTINVRNFYVGVELLGENSTHSGYLDITDINGSITNITNDKKLINSGLVSKMIAHAKFMDEGTLTASFRFPLNSETGEYYYGGKLSRMKMDVFNPLLENLYFVSIRDGIIDSLKFNISANDDYAVGDMKFVYHNLKFDIHNKKKTDSLIINKRGFVSMLANSIVKNDNPKHKGGRIKPARIYYERDIYHSVFHYWAITALSGIKTTMGFKSKELKERLKWEKIYEKNKRIFAKKEKKISRKEKRKNRKEINKDLKADLRREEKEKKKQKDE